MDDSDFSMTDIMHDDDDDSSSDDDDDESEEYSARDLSDWLLKKNTRTESTYQEEATTTTTTAATTNVPMPVKTAPRQPAKVRDISKDPEDDDDEGQPRRSLSPNGFSPRRTNRRRPGRTNSRRADATNSSMNRSSSCTRLPKGPPLASGDNGDHTNQQQQALTQRQRSQSLGPGGGGLMVTARDNKNPLTGLNIRSRDLLLNSSTKKNADWDHKKDLYSMLQPTGTSSGMPTTNRTGSAKNLTQYLEQAKTANAAAAANNNVTAQERRKSSNDLLALVAKAKASNERRNSSNNLSAMIIGNNTQNNNQNATMSTTNGNNKNSYYQRPASSNDLLAMLGKANNNTANANGTATVERRQSGKDVMGMLDLKKFKLSDSKRALLG